MIVTSDFEGGNAKIISVDSDKVTLNVELRDTDCDWFFWCFKVIGAEGKTVTFTFENKDRIGYFGAAVSYDYENWHWQHSAPEYNGACFTYTFKDNEKEVYFAHDMLYRPKRFFEFAENNNIPLKVLCKSKGGKDVPYIDTENGNECILLTARHHACESTGSYVLEGVLSKIIKSLSDKYRIICIPFVDYDGVINGDQGKCRVPYDHNRDYNKNSASIYCETAKIREITDNLNIRFAFDFHSPWHLSKEADTLFMFIHKFNNMTKKAKRFSELFEQETRGNAALMHFSKDNIYLNESEPSFAYYFNESGAELAFTLETPYFKTNNAIITQEKLVNTGKCFADALGKYIGG